MDPGVYPGSDIAVEYKKLHVTRERTVNWIPWIAAILVGSAFYFSYLTVVGKYIGADNEDSMTLEIPHLEQGGTIFHPISNEDILQYELRKRQKRAVVEGRGAVDTGSGEGSTGTTTEGSASGSTVTSSGTTSGMDETTAVEFFTGTTVPLDLLDYGSATTEMMTASGDVTEPMDDFTTATEGSATMADVTTAEGSTSINPTTQPLEGSATTPTGSGDEMTTGFEITTGGTEGEMTTGPDFTTADSTEFSGMEITTSPIEMSGTTIATEEATTVFEVTSVEETTVFDVTTDDDGGAGGAGAADDGLLQVPFYYLIIVGVAAALLVALILIGGKAFVKWLRRNKAVTPAGTPSSSQAMLQEEDRDMVNILMT